MLRIYLFLLLFMSTEETGLEIDLVFALNTPSLMSATDLSNAVDFIYNITERLTIGLSNSLVAAVTYSKYSTQYFNLTAHSSKEAVLSAFATMKSANRTFEDSNSNEVLDFIRTRIFPGSRATSEKLVVLIMVKGPTGTVQTIWAGEDLFKDYTTELITVGLDSLTDIDKSLLRSIAKDDSRTFYVSDFKYSCHIVPNVTILIDSTADTSIIEDCPDPYATDTTTVYPTKDESFPMVTIGALIGFLLLLACIIIVYKVVKGNTNDLAVLRAIEVYGEARLGTSKGSFCLDDLGRSSRPEENRSSYTQRLALARNFTNLYRWHNSR